MHLPRAPRLYRTWMYHESYRHHKNIDATSEDAGVIREILNFMCIDADLSAGWDDFLKSWGLVATITGGILMERLG